MPAKAGIQSTTLRDRTEAVVCLYLSKRAQWVSIHRGEKPGLAGFVSGNTWVSIMRSPCCALDASLRSLLSGENFSSFL
jgi:hypothetical protein